MLWLTTLVKTMFPSSRQSFLERINTYFYLQRKAMVAVAYCGGIRATENKALEYSDVVFSKNPKEVKVIIRKAKNLAQGRFFSIVDPLFVDVFEKYKAPTAIATAGYTQSFY